MKKELATGFIPIYVTNNKYYLQNQTNAGMGDIVQTVGNIAQYGGNALP